MKFKMIAAALVAASGFGAASLPTVASAEVLVARMSPKLCIDINQSNNTLALWGCHAGANQNFFSGGYGQIQFGGRCVQGGTKGGDVILTGCANVPSQKWGRQANGELKNETGYCLDIPNGNASQGAKLTMWDCNGGQNQKWGQGTVVSGASVGIAGGVQAGALYGSGGRLIGQDGAGIISRDGAGLIGMDGGTLIRVQ